MRIYLPKFKNNKGKSKPLSRFYIDFKDQNNFRRRLVAFSDAGTSEAFMNKLDILINRVQGGIPIENDADLMQWIAKMDSERRDKLIQWGLIPEQYGKVNDPLENHIADYIAYLSKQDLSADYVSRMKKRLTVICEGCGFTSFKNIHPAKLEAYLDQMKEKKYSPTSRNHYGDALKGFLNWCVSRDGGCRLSGNPLACITKETRDSERKGVLTPEQFILLVHKTMELNKTIHSSIGRERGVLYLLAGSTGLRRGELLSLLWSDLHLDDSTPYVHARAAITKNAQDARMPLPVAVAAGLKEFQGGKSAADPVFSFAGRWIDAAKWIRFDLKNAGLPLTDREGNEICFHSLRNSFISFLANSNTPMKVVQKLARHSDPKLTYNTYARSFAATEKEAMLQLPNFIGLTIVSGIAKTLEQVGTETNKFGSQTAIECQKTAFLPVKTIPPRGFELTLLSTLFYIKTHY
jgi:integrase